MVIADAVVNGFLPYKGLAGKNASLAKSLSLIHIFPETRRSHPAFEESATMQTGSVEIPTAQIKERQVFEAQHKGEMLVFSS